MSAKVVPLFTAIEIAGIILNLSHLEQVQRALGHEQDADIVRAQIESLDVKYKAMIAAERGN